MARQVTIDKAGRIVVPKPVREELGLTPGDVLEIDVEGPTLKLRPLRASSPLHKEYGIWVYRTDPAPAIDAEAVLASMRDERSRDVLGR